jgi:hypothetical protein
VEKSSLFAIRSVPSHGRGKQLADGGKPLFRRRGTLGIGDNRWLRSSVWKQQTRLQDKYDAVDKQVARAFLPGPNLEKHCVVH